MIGPCTKIADRKPKLTDGFGCIIGNQQKKGWCAHRPFGLCTSRVSHKLVIPYRQHSNFKDDEKEEV